ncbi:MAG: hypothetical protein HY554_02030 [Elusimicrobia bacterium]|nr:hypothetical protein [Elusimicrobiota bacterium]
MLAAALTALGLALPAGAEEREVELRPPPIPAAARPASRPADSSLDPFLLEAIDRVENDNLESSAAAADADAAKTLRLVWSLMAASQADVDGVLASPAGARRAGLASSRRALAALGERWREKAKFAGWEAPREEGSLLAARRAGYNYKNRAADLRRVRLDAERAGRRLGARLLPIAAEEALDALAAFNGGLEGCLRRTAAGGPFRSIELDLRDLQRELEILRAQLLLHDANDRISGRARR